MNMVMVDIEALATRHDARVLSIGACAVSNIYAPPKEWDTFLVSIPNEDSEGYFVDPDTVKWWAKQGDEAQEALSINAVDDTGYALTAFNEWLEGIGFAKDRAYNRMTNTIWANPPQFDLTILRHAYEVEGIECPWHHRQARCCRTVWAGRDRQHVKVLTPPRNLVKHRADDDAIRQMCGLVGIKQYEERINELTTAVTALFDGA